MLCEVSVVTYASEHVMRPDAEILHQVRSRRI